MTGIFNKINEQVGVLGMSLRLGQIRLDSMTGSHLLG
jgi:hypothetical protein